MKNTQPVRLRIGAFGLDLKTGELRSGDATTLLREQPLQVLRMLVECEGELLSREEIRKRLWPNDTIVEFDHSINAAIRSLRRALGDSAEEPKYIETLARRGYRLMVAVEQVSVVGGQSSEPSQTTVVPSELQPAALTGRVVSHYRVLDIMGGGGMGVVYRAEDLKLGRQVALKFLPEEVGDDPKALERFEREARAASALDHPNICSVYEFGEHEGRPFLVMQLLEGETLRERLASAVLHRAGPNGSGAEALPLDELLDIAGQTADGLVAAHERGVIHRDIKPANIFITRRGLVKILDFGVAKLTEAVEAPGFSPANKRASEETGLQHRPMLEPNPDEGSDHRFEARYFHQPATLIDTRLTRTGLAMGTVGYMSPEQVRGEKLDARTDIFSFGLVLYEMATGQRAFTGETAVAVHDAILNNSPIPVRELNAALPARMVTTIDKALEKDRGRRYQSAAEMRTDLEELEGGQQANISRRSAPGRWKGVAEPPQRYQSMAQVSAALQSISTRVEDIQPSIAVLPFANMSFDQEQEFFSDGLTEEIINLLAQIVGLKVTARTSAFAFKGKNDDIRRIAEALGVTHVLEGSVRRAGNRLRITAELIHAADGTHLWSQRYDREMEDAFAVQDEIAGAIATSLRARMGLAPQEHRRLADRRPFEAEAHEAYLKGRYFWNKRTKDGLERAIRYFREATEKNPTYALAYAGLADSYFLMASPAYGGLKPTEAHQMGKLAAYRAVEIDEMLPEVHTALAQLKLMEFDWAGAQKELRRAIELNSSYATAYHWYGLVLSALGRFDEAIAAVKVACCLDPLSAIIARDLGLVFYYARQLDRAVEQYRKTLDFEPDFVPARQSLGRAYLDKKMYDEALQEIEKADALSGGAIYTRAALAQAYAVIGRTGDVNKILAELTARSRSSHVPPMTFAVIYIALRDNNAALDWLEKAYAEHDIGVRTLKVQPIFDSLRHELRFQNLLCHMNLI